MKKILCIIVVIIIVLGLLWVIWLFNPIVTKNNVYHAKYGKYPRVVPFSGTIMPMQTAIMGQPTSIKKNEDGTTTVTWK